MRIQRLKLSNFKHFEDQAIELNDGINVLIGENNAGKTSIIQAIAAIFNIPFGGSIENDFPSKLIDPPFTTRIEIDVLLAEQELNILKGIRNIDIQRNRRFNKEEWDKINYFIIENNLSFKLRLDVEVSDRGNVQLRRGGLNREDLDIYLRVNEIRELIYDLNEDIDHNALMNKINVNLNIILLNSINNPPNLPFRPLILFPYLSDFRSNESFISYNKLQQSLKGDYRFRNIRSQLFHLKRKNPDAFTKFSRRMEENFQGISDVDIEYNFDNGYLNLKLDSYGRDITLYGGGTQTFAQIFSIIGFEDVGPILIDEPDAHLHASLAEKFVEYLKELSISKQIIFTTHLPGIIDFVPIDSIISVEIKNGKAIFNKPVNEKDLIYQLSKMGIFPSIYIRELLKRAEIIIFTEGVTDKPILNQFILKYQKVIDNEKTIPKIEYLPIGKRYSSDLNKMKTGILNFLNGKIILYIRDKDEDSPEEIKRVLQFDGFHVHVWEYRQIENYLLDPIAISSLIFSRKTDLELQDIKNQIEQIISSEIQKQYPKLMANYIENRSRDELPKPKKEFDFGPSTPIDKISSILHESLISKKAFTHLGNIDKSKILLWVNEYSDNWKKDSKNMINAKKVLSEIRKFYEMNFQNVDIIPYIKEVPEEIKNLIENHLVEN